MVYKHMPGEPPSPSLTLHLRQRSLCLGQPEGHLHGAIHLHGRGQLSAGLLLLASCGIQHAEAPVAVRQEWAHAEFLGQGEGLVVMGGSLVEVWGLATHGDLAEEPVSMCLVTA